MTLGYLFTDPAEFFDRRWEADGTLPVVVVTLAAVPGAAATYLTLAPMASEAPRLGLLGVLVATLTTFLIPPAIWVALTALFHVVGLALDGWGSFLRTARFVSWGFVPYALGSTVVLGGVVVTLSQVPAPTSGAEVDAFARAVERATVYRYAKSFNAGMLLWSALLWTVGLSEALSVSRGRAAAVVTLPTAVLLWFNLVAV